MLRRIAPRLSALCISSLLLAVTVIPVTAQTSDGDASSDTPWRIVAVVLLVAFITAVAFLMTTRWRRLIHWRNDGD